MSEKQIQNPVDEAVQIDPASERTADSLKAYDKIWEELAHPAGKEPRSSISTYDSLYLPNMSIATGIAEDAIRLHPQLDTNSNGRVEAPEMRSALRNPVYQGRDAVAVAAIYQYRNELPGLRDDDTLPEGIKVSKADLEELRDVTINHREQYRQSIVLGNQINGLFDKVDRDDNGYLSEDELKFGKEISQSPDSNNLRDFVDTATQLHTAKGKPSKGITKEDLQEKRADMVPQEGLPEWLEGFGKMLPEQLELGKSALFGTRGTQRDGVAPDAVAHGPGGDQIFLATLKSMSANEEGRSAIINMIKENKRGAKTTGYTVTFPGAPDEPVTVNPPTASELAAFARPTRGGTWPAVLQKAMGQFAQEYPHRVLGVDLISSSAPQDLNYGKTSYNWNDAQTLLTGRGYFTMNTAWPLNSNRTFHETLSSAMHDGRPVLAYPALTGNMPAGVYGVVRYDETKQVVHLQRARQTEIGGHNSMFPESIRNNYEMSLNRFRGHFRAIEVTDIGAGQRDD